jgi:hypothetical protein
MIKPTELRVGNRIKYNNREAKIISIHEAGILSLSSGVNADLKNIRPIKLSDELLLRYGFIRNNEGTYKHNHRELTEVFHTLDEFFFRFDGKFIASCKYLHELQNIFFALYKQEIGIVRSAVLG